MAIVLFWPSCYSNLCRSTVGAPLILAFGIYFIKLFSLQSCDSSVFEYLSLAAFRWIQGLFE